MQWLKIVLLLSKCFAKYGSQYCSHLCKLELMQYVSSGIKCDGYVNTHWIYPCSSGKEGT